MRQPDQIPVTATAPGCTKIRPDTKSTKLWSSVHFYLRGTATAVSHAIRLWGEGASDSVAKKELAAHSAHSGFETVQDKQHMGNIKLYTGPSNCFVFLY